MSRIRTVAVSLRFSLRRPPISRNDLAFAKATVAPLAFHYNSTVLGHGLRTASPSPEDPRRIMTTPELATTATEITSDPSAPDAAATGAASSQSGQAKLAPPDHPAWSQ